MIHAEGFEQRVPAERADPGDWIAEMDKSTRLTWLWALLLGPIYFAAHGFHRQALLVLALDLVLVGLLLTPFLARRAWRARARTEAAWLRGMLDARGRAVGPVPA